MMKTALLGRITAALVVGGIVSAASADKASAQSSGQVCTPRITANNMLVTAQQRYQAGQKAEPPLTDKADGFAWPDTPLGVIRTQGGYEYFGSDGGSHARQLWQGQWYGNNRYGSITRTIGTLGDPLGVGPPMDVTIRPNPDPAVNPNYGSYDYIGGGPVYKVPPGPYGDSDLLLVYHAEMPTVSTQSFLSALGLAASTDGGASWTDLGEIVRVNQAYRADIDGFDIGDPPLVVSPDGAYFLIYFRDWIANGTTHWGNTLTSESVARAPVSSVLADAFGDKPHAAPFEKYYRGNWDHQPGIGGISTDLIPGAPYAGDAQVAYDSAISRYVMIIGEGVVIAYSESADGMTWTLPTLLYDFRNDPDQPSSYVMPVGEGFDPMILGAEYYIYYTRYPNAGPHPGWAGATVDRLTVSCP